MVLRIKMSKIKDAELRQYADEIGHQNYRNQYQLLYQRTMQAADKRYSGLHYKNSPEKLKQLKEKYKNGVSKEIINIMLGVKE